MANFKTVLLASALAFFPFHAVSAADAVPAKKPVAAAPAKTDGKPVRPNRFFLGADANHDGKLAKQEFMMVHEKYFNETDTNKDNFLSPEEMKAQGDRKRAERRAARAAKKRR